jgi:hypothetical protein
LSCSLVVKPGSEDRKVLKLGMVLIENLVLSADAGLLTSFAFWSVFGVGLGELKVGVLN